MKRYDDSQPVMVLDYEEASNLTFDAGMYSFLRYMVGDYGMDYPFVGSPTWTAAGASMSDMRVDNFELRFGISPMRRGLQPYRDMLNGVPSDSIYARKYLISFPNIQPGEERYYAPQYLDKMVFSTDYSPRMPGNWRYQGNDLPVSTEVICPSPTEDMHLVYRDRRYVLQGFAHPAEFYSPDYSQGRLPAQPTDYRRTLYWNPHLTLDDQGEATVTTIAPAALSRAWTCRDRLPMAHRCGTNSNTPGLPRRCTAVRWSTKSTAMADAEHCISQRTALPPRGYARDLHMGDVEVARCLFGPMVIVLWMKKSIFAYQNRNLTIAEVYKLTQT